MIRLAALAGAALLQVAASSAFAQGFELPQSRSPLAPGSSSQSSASIPGKSEAKARTERVQIELLPSKMAVAPGDEITIALKQTIKPGWHTYWTNPGDSGEPTHIDWKLPAGARAGAILWPLPDAIPVGPLMNYGYSDEVILLSEMTVPQGSAKGYFDISADVHWLVCEEICVPESASVKLSLPYVDGTISMPPSPNVGLIAKTRANLPKPMPWPAEYGLSEGADNTLTIRFDNIKDRIAEGAEAYFFPVTWGELAHAEPQTVSFEDGDLYVRTKTGDAFAAEPPASISGVLSVTEKSGERHGYQIHAAHSAVAITAPQTATPLAADSSGGLSVWVALGFAFLGGLILNLMPCVFPVLTLKALSLVKNADNASVRRVKGFAYFAGVLASFTLIAAALLALRAGGSVIGWGMQFQSPGFVLLMMALFLGLALNMSGVYHFGSSVCNVGDNLTRRSGLRGDFFTGVLATVVATPCTAPFMGAAMGYAFTQPALIVVLVLIALGVGFGLPILLLSLSPAFARLMPKPGAWMETFRQVMAFPLYATAAWLLWVLSIQLGSNGVLLGSALLVAVGFAAWLYGRSDQTSRAGSLTAISVAILAMGLSAWTVSDGFGNQQSRIMAQTSGEYDGPKAETFTRARLDELLAHRQPVFINLTAAWCITCKVNEQVALKSEAFSNALEENNVTYLVGDWTNGDPEITALLSEQGRVGVPLYLLYTGEAGVPPKVFPQILTGAIILDAFADVLGDVARTAQKLN
ncbi:MAG: thioredoxin family protein [Hyphomicrobiales bacterium]|nr:thioredoxin family protein [Hyphomicrobiales bacterium]